MELPHFKYHPDPIASETVKRQSGTCVCCEKQVEYLYVASAYSVHDLSGKLCPWCIADGSAHKKYDVSFADSYPLSEAGISEDIIEEVTCRTPGYISWQQEEWLSHCNDACAFLGDATPETIRNVTPEELAPLIAQHGIDQAFWEQLASHYQPGGQPAIYHFRCLHCGINRLGMDYT